jgi:anti-anti-sigma regulatory factor
VTAVPGTVSRLEVVDRGSGTVRAGGQLTEQGVDLLRGVALALQHRGHARITLDLAGVHAVDDAGLRALRTVQESMSAELVVLHAPGAVGT